MRTPLVRMLHILGFGFTSPWRRRRNVMPTQGIPANGCFQRLNADNGQPGGDRCPQTAPHQCGRFKQRQREQLSAASTTPAAAGTGRAGRSTRLRLMDVGRFRGEAGDPLQHLAPAGAHRIIGEPVAGEDEPVVHHPDTRKGSAFRSPHCIDGIELAKLTMTPSDGGTGEAVVRSVGPWRSQSPSLSCFYDQNPNLTGCAHFGRMVLLRHADHCSADIAGVRRGAARAQGSYCARGSRGCVVR